MPVGVRKMEPAVPLAAARAELFGGLGAGLIHVGYSLTLLFLRLYGCCIHRVLHGRKGAAAGKGSQRAVFATPA